MTTRRDFFKKGLLAGAGLALLKTGLAHENIFVGESKNGFALPPLPYAVGALEPYIDKTTMEIHHGKHHQGYVNKLNAAMQEAKLSNISIEDICKDVSKYSTAIRNNAGGHFNHSLFWKAMKPNEASVLAPTSPNMPSGKLAEAINDSFESFANFKTLFAMQASSRFGSGWAWLVVNTSGKLELGSTPNQDNPLMDVSIFKGKPVLGLDVWEHAYYLKYQNKRADYINSWWNIVNWQEANQRFEAK